ncbi:MAG: copper amine oxidase N-terminal domain-containing protein [Ruminococcaceae bacterium]|nr:copper amine oxidase N-terminal domain-containing protein [Oscillospiraceae bacterium]
MRILHPRFLCKYHKKIIMFCAFCLFKNGLLYGIIFIPNYKKGMIKMKKILSIILAVVMVLSSLTFVMAADDIKITINGEAKKFDVMPQIIEGRTLVPMRAIFEALGAEVGWDDATKTASGKTASTTVALTIDNKEAKVNGKAVTLDVPAMIIDSRTMVPARFVAESLGCKVDWDGNTKTVIITMEKKEEAKPSADGMNELVKITFEDKKVAPSSSINFWGKLADGKNTNSTNSYVTYAEAGISKPNTTEDFGTSLVKADASKGKEGPSVSGLAEGRVNDIPANLVNFAEGNKYKMSCWIYLAEVTDGGSSAKVAFKPYAGKSTSALKGAKTFTLKKGEWTKLEIEFAPTAKEAGMTTGARFTFAAVDGKNAQVVYIDNLVFRGTATASAAPAPEAPKTEEKKEEAVKPAVGAEKILDATLPQSGTVIATQKDFATCVNGKANKDKDGAVEITAQKQENDNKQVAISKTSLSGLIKEGNVYMLTFKARVTSGNPYLKAYIQASKENGYKKAVFAATSYGKEWTTCYMPFVGNKYDMEAWGFRVAGETHTTEIKDLQIIDYGTSVKIADLPHTYIVVGNTDVSGLKLD